MHGKGADRLLLAGTQKVDGLPFRRRIQFRECHSNQNGAVFA
jgi:hypothetical protein